MSVELRGPLKHNPAHVNPFNHQESNQDPNVVPSSQENDTKDKPEWEWTGVWSFTQEMTYQPGASNRKVASKRMTSTSIPKTFHYKFQNEKDPLSVEIPSSAMNTSDEKDEDSEKDKETYGSGEYYKDANSIYPSICPKGGSWKGYFENVLSGPARTRDKKSTTRVEETFYLFFNCKPPPNAKSTFDEESMPAMSEGEESGSENKPRKVHVRGMGTNLFGTFEILGWLDISTKILHCQRSYLPLQKAATKRSRSHSVGTKNTERKYFTRKKIMSWQRPTDSDEEKPQLMRGLSGGKKRQRSSSHSNLERSLSTASVTTASTGENVVKVQESETQNSTVQVSATPALATTTKPTLSDQPISKVTQSPAPIQPAKKKSIVKDKPKSIHLPPISDNMDARWRSAHYIFYQRITNPSDDTSSAAATTTTTTCIYEGQYLNGYGMREGFGICLYPNGNIYEGGFRRNKESGFGKYNML